jgi:hypothetical protein
MEATTSATGPALKGGTRSSRLDASGASSRAASATGRRAVVAAASREEREERQVDERGTPAGKNPHR